MKVSCLFFLLCGLPAAFSAQVKLSAKVDSAIIQTLEDELQFQLSRLSRSVYEAIKTSTDILGLWDPNVIIQVKNPRLELITERKLDNGRKEIQFPLEFGLLVKFLRFQYVFNTRASINILTDENEGAFNVDSCGLLADSLEIYSEVALGSKTFFLGRIEQTLKEVLSIGLERQMCPLINSWLSRPWFTKMLKNELRIRSRMIINEISAE